MDMSALFAFLLHNCKRRIATPTMSVAPDASASVLSGAPMSQLRTPVDEEEPCDPPEPTSHTKHAKHAKQAKHTNHSRVAHVRKGSAISREDVVGFAHRVAIFGAALFYVVSCFQAIPDIVRLLKGNDNEHILYAPEDSAVMRKFVGTTTLRESPLVMTVLGGSTAPVATTVYLDTNGSSFSSCSGEANPGVRLLYENSHLRLLYSVFTTSLAYNITMLKATETELIAPVVDCTISEIGKGDTTFMRSFYLVRKISDPDDVYMVPIRMAAMEYYLPDQEEGGPAGVATLAFVNDLRANWVEHYTVVSIGFPFEKLDFRAYDFNGLESDGSWSLQTIPRDPSRELSKRTFVAAKAGCYVKTESEQSNVNYNIWVLDPFVPIKALVQMQHTSVAVLQDSWAWVHLVNFWLGFDVLVNLLILLAVSCHNLRSGVLWMGDSFVAVSSTLFLRGAVVVLSLYVDKFWSLTEFVTFDATAITGLQTLSIYESITHADLLSLYLCLAGVIGMVFRARVDPLLAVICFEIGYGCRRAILQWFPALFAIASDYAHAIYASSTRAAMEGQSNITPMQFSTTFETQASGKVILAVLVAVPLSVGLILLYVAASKVYFHFFPDKLLVLRSKNTSNTNKSDNEDALLAQKRQFTLFEIATGAQLENRFGLLSHYITCVFVKGTKFASPDGIYSNGFLIANSKFLVQARDLVWIVLMKASQSRFTNIYVYELQGNSVQQKARLVYPETLSWADIFFVNITILS